MAHDIYGSNMAYAGELPWHGLGKNIPANATIDDVLKAVSFYKVEERPIFAAGVTGPLPDRKALVAGDDGRYLSTVSADYGVIQFEELYAPLIKALDGKVVFHTAALLGKRGERGFLLCEFPEGLKVMGDKSPYRAFAMMRTGHDGMTASSVIDTNVRAVCANTERAAMSIGGEHLTLNVRHTSNAAARFESDFGALLGSLKSRRETFGRVSSFLNGVQTAAPQRNSFVKLMLPMPEAPAKGADKDTRDAFEKRAAKVEEQRGVFGGFVEGKTGNTTEIFGTVWGMYQAAVEYADHARGGSNADGAERLEALVDGTPAKFKLQAWNTTLDVTSLSGRVAEMATVGA